jgi:hypothetical protein
MCIDPCSNLSIYSNNEDLQIFCTHKHNYRNNIGNDEEISPFGPIDVVYTWVNGSDDRWRKKKDFWFNRMIGNENNIHITNDNNNKTSTDSNINMTLVSNSIVYNSMFNDTVSLNVSNNNASLLEDILDEVIDDRISLNRYRDSNELRYSLRSLIKNAPWVRHIYIVVDNQIPSWLNVDTDKLTIISHEDIFENKLDLPVFSSPAIESQLHRIPGLSKKFIYFNDDVLLGSKTLLDDFISMSGVQKFYMSWDIPKCSPGCSDSWIGDGFCDKACNVSECDFDFPDCVNSTSGTSTYNNGASSKPNYFCQKGCPDSWLADKVCDQRCKVEACGYDIGDCGLAMVTDSYPGVIITSDMVNTSIVRANYDDNNQVANIIEDIEEINETNVTVDMNNSTSISQTVVVPNVLSVPIGTKAVYFNISYLRCASTSNEIHNDAVNKDCFVNDVENFKYVSSEHTEGVPLHLAILISKHDILVVLLDHGQDDSPDISEINLPHIATITITGFNSGSNITVSTTFSFTIESDASQVLNNLGYVSNMGVISGYSSYCSHIDSNKSDNEDINILSITNTSNLEIDNNLSIISTNLLSRPFSSLSTNKHDNSNFQGIGIEIQISQTTINLPLKSLFVRYLLTLKNGNTFIKYSNLCEMIARPSKEKKSVPYMRLFQPYINHNDSNIHNLSKGINNNNMYNYCYNSNLVDILQNEADKPSYHSIESTYKHVKSSELLKDINTTYFTLLIPMPKLWTDVRHSWVHMKAEIFHNIKDILIPTNWMRKKFEFNSNNTNDNDLISNRLACVVSSFNWGGRNESIDTTKDILNVDNSSNNNSSSSSNNNSSNSSSNSFDIDTISDIDTSSDIDSINSDSASSFLPPFDDTASSLRRRKLINKETVNRKDNSILKSLIENKNDIDNIISLPRGNKMRKLSHIDEGSNKLSYIHNKQHSTNDGNNNVANTNVDNTNDSSSYMKLNSFYPFCIKYVQSLYNRLLNINQFNKVDIIIDVNNHLRHVAANILSFEQKHDQSISDLIDDFNQFKYENRFNWHSNNDNTNDIRRRRLSQDTYASSLIHVNRLYSKV